MLGRAHRFATRAAINRLSTYARRCVRADRGGLACSRPRHFLRDERGSVGRVVYLDGPERQLGHPVLDDPFEVRPEPVRRNRPFGPHT